MSDGEVTVSVKSSLFKNIGENEILIFSYFHFKEEGLLVKIEESSSKSVFMKVLVGSMERSSLSNIDKVRVLKCPAADDQKENAKGGSHLILVLTVGDVEVSVELSGKGVLVQTADAGEGLVRKKCMGSYRDVQHSTGLKLGAKDKGSTDFCFKDFMTYLVDADRVGNKNLVLMIFEHLTHKKIQQVRQDRQDRLVKQKKKNKLKKVFKRKESDSSLEWDLNDDDSYCISSDSCYKDCDNNIGTTTEYHTPSPTKPSNNHRSSSPQRSSPPRRRSPSPPRRRSPSPPRRRSPSPPRATFRRRSPSPPRFSFGGGRSSPCGGGRSSPCGGGGGGWDD